MIVRKPIIVGLMGLAALGTCKAQKVQFATETGVNGAPNQELTYFNGLHTIFDNNKNNTDVYCGLVADTEKQFTFETQLENEYSWTNNISSWVRETFHLSKRENNLTSEFAPIKANVPINKFDTFVAPVYILQNDFKEKEHVQSIGVVLNATYNADESNSIKFEAEYASEPAKNIFKTSFGKLKDNLSYIVSYIRKL